MADLKKLTDDVAARAALSAGKEMAQKALDDILPPNADARDGSTKGKEQGSSSRRWWVAAGVIAAIFLVIGVVGLLMAYWQWFLVAGAVGLAGLYGYYRLRGRRARSKKPKAAKADSAHPEPTRAVKTAAKSRDDEDAPALAAKLEREADEARLRELEAQRDAAAEREARAEREREVDDELAAMKARIKREP